MRSALLVLMVLVTSASAKPLPRAAQTALSKAKACKYTADDGIDSDCAAYSNWTGIEIEDPTPLIPLALGKDAKVRFLALDHLMHLTGAVELDAKTFEKFLVLASKEKHKALAGKLGLFVSKNDLVKLGKVDRAIEVAKAQPHDVFRFEFMTGVGWNQRNIDPKIVEYAKELATSKTTDMRLAALYAFSKLSSLPGACAGIDALRKDSDSFVYQRAASELAKAKCASHYDALLDDLAKLDVTKDIHQDFGIALHRVCEHKDAKDAVRKKALGIAKKLTLAPAVHSNTRYYTMSAVVACDPKDGKAFIAKLKTDKNPTIASRADELTK